MEASPSLWTTTLERLRAKPPFGGPRQVLRYLARYTHRVAIGNSRILDYDDDHVTFRYKKVNASGTAPSASGPNPR